MMKWREGCGRMWHQKGWSPNFWGKMKLPWRMWVKGDSHVASNDEYKWPEGEIPFCSSFLCSPVSAKLGMFCTEVWTRGCSQGGLNLDIKVVEIPNSSRAHFFWYFYPRRRNVFCLKAFKKCVVTWLSFSLSFLFINCSFFSNVKIGSFQMV